MSQLYASLFYQQDVTEIFSDRALVKYMIETEVALAQAQAAVGVIPQSAADIITLCALGCNQSRYSRHSMCTAIA